MSVFFKIAKTILPTPQGENLKHLQKAFMYFCRIFPINKKKVVFSSYFGTRYDDNPRAIFVEMVKQCPNWEYIWLMPNDKIKIQHAKTVVAGSFDAIYHLATAKIWIDNVRKNYWLVKRKKQYYIQTWHGNIGNKKIEAAVSGKLSGDYVRSAKNDSKMANIIISGSDFFTKIVKKYFWYDGEVLECGTPRLDIFFTGHDKILHKVKSIFAVDKNTKIILYAPTFRDGAELSIYEINFEAVLDSFERLFNCSCIMLVRLHPNVAHKKLLMKDNDKVINATDYPDLYELLISCDAVISDYSSLMFEAGLLFKPVFQYMQDIDEYRKQRGFWIDPYKLPFITATNEEELLNAIDTLDNETYREKLRTFYKKLGIKEDGKASKRLVNLILNFNSIENIRQDCD